MRNAFGYQFKRVNPRLREQFLLNPVTLSAESGKCVQLAERVGECGRVEVAS